MREGGAAAAAKRGAGIAALCQRVPRVRRTSIASLSTKKPDDVRRGEGRALGEPEGRVFGVYAEPPESKPSMGLTGRPPLLLTPMGLALLERVELMKELGRNRGFDDRLKILLGPTS